MKKYLPAIAWFLLVLILICLPGDDLPQADNWMAAIYFDKWVHTGLFCILAFLFMLPVAKSGFTLKVKWRYITRIGVSASIWGLTTEFIQKFFIPGRAFDLLDWAADSFGIAVAIFTAAKIYPGINNGRSKTNQA